MLTNPETLPKALLLSSDCINLKVKRKTYSRPPYRFEATLKTLRCGFSLVELLVVIAVIALLLSILMPLFGKAKSMAMRLKCAHNLKQINLAVNLYLNVNEDTYPCADDPLPAGYWVWMGRGWRSFLEPYLVENINADNPSVLFCPQDHTAKDNYESTSYAYSMAFYHSPQQIDAMSSPADTYGKTSVPSIPQRCSDVAKPSGKILIGEWLSNHSRINNDQGWWDRRGYRNHLFVDDQVRFLKAEHIRLANDGLPNPNLTIHGIKGLDYAP